MIRQTLDKSQQAVDSLKVQWVIVDDGSVDQSVEQIQKWLEANPGLPVVTIRQPNRGAAAARNAGLEKAEGRYILFLDSDDALLPGWLPKAVNHLDHSGDSDICYTGYRIVDDSGKVRRTSQAFTENQAIAGILSTWITHPDAILYRAALVEKISGFREDMPAMQDHEFTLRAFLAAKKTKRFRGYGVDIRESGTDRISVSRFTKPQPHILHFLEEAVALLKAHNRWESHQQYWQTRCESYIYQFLRSGLKNEAAKVAKIKKQHFGESRSEKLRLGIAGVLPAYLAAAWYRRSSGRLG